MSLSIRFQLFSLNLPYLSELGKQYNRLAKTATPANDLIAAPKEVEDTVARIRENLQTLRSFAEEVERLLTARSGAGLPVELKRSFETSLAWLEGGEVAPWNGA